MKAATKTKIAGWYENLLKTVLNIKKNSMDIPKTFKIKIKNCIVCTSIMLAIVIDACNSERNCLE